MPLTSFHRKLGLISGCLGCLQGVAWLTMAAICLKNYYQGVDVDMLLSNSFNSAVYWRFLDQTSKILSEGIIVVPKAFTSFMWIYVVLCTCWLIISLNQIYDIKKESVKLSESLKLYAYVSILISVTDLLLCIGIGMDMRYTCAEDVPKRIETCRNGDVPVLIIVGKGLILWLFNVISGIILYKSSKILRKEEEENETVESSTDCLHAVVLPVITNTDNSIDSSVLQSPQYSFEYRYVYRPRQVLRYNAVTAAFEYQTEYRYEYNYEWGPTTNRF